MTNATTRRRVLKCMAWAGTGVLWTVCGGIPRSLAIEGATPKATASERTFSFVQISDSHIGFNKEANPDVTATLQQAIAKINGLPEPPAFVVHTGDITHLSKPAEFDLADQILSTLRVDALHVVPGEHDVIGDDGKAFLDRYGKGKRGTGWYSFDQAGVHFIALVNVLDLQAGGLGHLGEGQLEWLEDDLHGRSASTPIVVFAHMPLWLLYPDWGWGTDDSAQALSYLKRFASVTVLNGHIHQVQQMVEGNVSFRTAMSTAYPQPAPGAGSSPGPLTVPAQRLRSVLGVRDVTYAAGDRVPAIVDAPLASAS